MLTVVWLTHHGRKGKRRQEQDREARQNESEVYTSKVGGKNDLKIWENVIPIHFTVSEAQHMN